MIVHKDVVVSDTVTVSNRRPLTVFAGLNVLESESLALDVATLLKSAAERHHLNLVFKASWDKANRSSIHSYRGPGLELGLSILAAVKESTGLPIVTDIHLPEHAEPVAAVADVLQIPAFLCRQTDLLSAACAQNKPILLKKMQMMAPSDTRNLVEKCQHLGQSSVLVCERGTSFGYGNLVVDPLSFEQLKSTGDPVVFDVTHALQQPGGLGHATDGRGHFTVPLALAGVSQGLGGLFFECHPEPAKALCDGPCALPTDSIDMLLEKVAALDRLVKSWSA